MALFDNAFHLPRQVSFLPNYTKAWQEDIKV
jgi:hypothetical protein